MKKSIFILLLNSILTISVYSQTTKYFYPKNTYNNLTCSNDTNYSFISLNTYFTYMFIENTSDKHSNAKGFGLDLQINQNNYTSWLLGFNISFYKRFSNNDIINLSTINLLAGPKFYFSTAKLSMYTRLNAGITFFSEFANNGIDFSVSFFPALGVEQNINKNFKLFIESTANINIDLMSTTGHFSINIGVISSF
jgi:hypothetical protein